MKPINGWTRKRMIECVEQYVPDTEEVSRDVENGCCRYLLDDGSRCAVGAMLGDDDIVNVHRNFEGYGVGSFYTNIQGRLPLTLPDLVSLQCVHDEEAPGNATARQRCVDWILNHVEEDQS